MSTPEISVVIPSYNYGRYLDDCLRSIFAQVNAPAFEVIVVDDGSTDDSMTVLERWSPRGVRMVRHARNAGHAAAINTGLPLARGRVIARLDPDDRYRPHFMATVMNRLETHPEAGAVYGRAALIDGDGALTGDLTDEPHAGEFVGSEFLALLGRNFICAPTFAARREAWLEVPPVPTHLAFHDWYFTLLMARSRPFCFVDDVVAEYRVHAANHHARIAQSGEEERSVLWLLDQVMGTREPTDAMERLKLSSRRGVLASHYRDFADKYFWFGRMRDARRCYLAAIRHRPGTLGDPGVLRRLAATVVGRRTYDGLKRLLPASGQARTR